MAIDKSEIARSVLEASGWTISYDIPKSIRKGVIVGAPHTSNWDVVLVILGGIKWNMNFKWVVKQTIYRPPFDRLLDKTGAIPVDRQSSHNYVEQLANVFSEHKEMFLFVAPEGTRSNSKRWKSGFYYIAKEANIPIILGYVDYPTKRIGLGDYVPAGTPKDGAMEQIRDFYSDKRGFNPDQFTEPRLK